MLISILSLNLIMTFMFLILNHPISMGVILLIQTILISLITGNFNQNLWFSYILFLIMIGGMLVLFMYMTSIASNEKFKFSIKSLLILALGIPMTLIISLFNNKLFINNEVLLFNYELNMNFSLNKFINFPLNMILIFMIIYLLLTLIVTVKITNFKKGPLRQMN